MSPPSRRLSGWHVRGRWSSRPAAITVNVVSPTATKTPMLLDPAAAASSRLPPIGRFVQPEEVAAATAFLLSEEAAAITGQMVMCGRSSCDLLQDTEKL